MSRPWSFTTLAAVWMAAASVFAQAPTMRYPTTGSGLTRLPYRSPTVPHVEPQPPAPPPEMPAPNPSLINPNLTKYSADPIQGKNVPHAADCDLPACTGTCLTWYGRAGANFMTRDDVDPIWLSYNTANLGDARLGTTDAEPGWGWGADVVLGRSFSNGAYGLEVAYWGITPSNQSADALDPDGTTGNATDLDTTLAFDSLNYNGTAAVDFFTNAEIHRLVRSYEAHNVELNLVGSPMGGLNYFYGDHEISFNWLVGARYLKFNDGFEYMTDDANTVFDGDVNELTYLIDIDNNFIGGQIGGGFNYRFHRVFSAYATGKAGLYGAYLSHRSRISGSAGDAVVNNALSPYNGQAFNVSSSKTDVAMIAELDTGFRYQFGTHWSAIMGYRAVGISGVALTTDQIPLYFADIGGVGAIDSTGSVILHGGYFGFQFLY